jgi:PAS domain S-box-containing protein
MISTVLLGSFLLLVTASEIITNLWVQRINEQGELAAQIERQAYELGYLANDYLLYRESQQADRWESKFASFSEILSNMQMDTPEQRALLANIKINQQRLRVVFTEVRASIESAPQAQQARFETNFMQLSWSRLEVQNQGLIFDAARLEKLLRNQEDRLKRVTSLLSFLLIGMLGAFLLVSYGSLFRRTLQAITDLQAGARMIGSGDLDYAIAVKNQDEIGELSLAFNQMTASLKEVTASKADLEREILERKQAEAALRQSEAHFRLALTHAPVSVATQDCDLVYTWAYNQKTRKPDEIIGKTDFDLFPSEAAHLMELKRRVLATGENISEQLWLTSKDQRLFLDLFIEPLRNGSGEIEGLGLATVDLTQLKLAEDSLRQNEALLQAVLDHIPDAVYLKDRDSRLLLANPATLAVIGKPAEAVLGRTDAEFYDDPATGRAIMENDLRIMDTGQMEIVEESVYGPKGARVYLSTKAPYYDAEGQIIGLIGTAHEITERVQAEQRIAAHTSEIQAANQELNAARLAALNLIEDTLKAQEELRLARDELELRVQERTKELEDVNQELLYEIYEREEAERQLLVQITAMEAAANGIMITDLAGEILWANPAITRMTGYSVDDLIGQTMRVFKSGQHGTEYYRDMWASILAGEVWQGETTNRRKDGSLYTEEQTITPVRGNDGQLSHFIAIKHDITAQKQIAAELELERTRLKNILDTIPDGVYIINHDYDIEYTNPVIEREFGLIEGQKCYAYFHDLAQPCPWCMNEKVMGGSPLSGERTYSKNNKSYEIFDAPLANTDGTVSKLKLLHDITQRKKMEQELEQRNQELQAASHAERIQRQAAETLRAATQALTQSLDLDTVLNTLLKHVTALVETDLASVGFVEDETRLVARVAQGSANRAKPEQTPIFPIDAKTDFFFQRVAASRKSLIVRDATRDPDWIGYPGVAPIRSWMGVPILVNEKVIGVVLLGKGERGFFTREHARSAEALVSQAAVAIQNAWLFEQVRAGRERLQLLSRRLVEIQESERRYIARELHDQAGQSLSSLILGLGQLEKGTGKNGDKEAQTRKLKLLANDILEDLHRLAVDLRPASLDHLGLVPALGQLVNTFAENEQLEVKFKAVGLSEYNRLPSEIETTLYRIVQEALTNVTRHAQATRADVLLEQRENAIVLIIEDNGIGFDATFSDDRTHLGLTGIRERTEMLGGSLIVESIIGSGTILVVEVPNANTHLAGG